MTTPFQKMICCFNVLGLTRGQYVLNHRSIQEYSAQFAGLFRGLDANRQTRIVEFPALALGQYCVDAINAEQQKSTWRIESFHLGKWGYFGLTYLVDQTNGMLNLAFRQQPDSPAAIATPQSPPHPNSSI